MDNKDRIQFLEGYMKNKGIEDVHICKCAVRHCVGTQNVSIEYMLEELSNRWDYVELSWSDTYWICRNSSVGNPNKAYDVAYAGITPYEVVKRAYEIEIKRNGKETITD